MLRSLRERQKGHTRGPIPAGNVIVVLRGNPVALGRCQHGSDSGKRRVDVIANASSGHLVTRGFCVLFETKEKEKKVFFFYVCLTWGRERFCDALVTTMVRDEGNTHSFCA